MGQNTYPNGFIRDNETGQNLIMNGPLTQIALRAVGEEFVNRAIELFAASSKGDDMAPILYPDHFGIREVHHGLVEAIEVYNDDPTAEWVEFGAHAGGKTRVLRYRILGRTADAMEAAAHL